MIEISPGVRLEENELRLEAVRASGPGGQNVNKVSSAIKLTFDVRNSASLPEEVKARLARLAGKRMTADGLLVIDARRYRTQEQNRQDALQRLAALIEKARQEPKPRRATRPSAATVRRRLEAKRRRALLKRARRQEGEDW
ncbi:MAG: alternative ribosome rescue aminoacyl-tRNA hydrolase ArfB [Anaerolineales bacterium]|nr:alternative ribosome rescue aminoacyl-tRNA hydrolase ArfB [Anaerolineales bacterium]